MLRQVSPKQSLSTTNDAYHQHTNSLYVRDRKYRTELPGRPSRNLSKPCGAHPDKHQRYTSTSPSRSCCRWARTRMGFNNWMARGDSHSERRKPLKERRGEGSFSAKINLRIAPRSDADQIQSLREKQLGLLQEHQPVGPHEVKCALCGSIVKKKYAGAHLMSLACQMRTGSHRGGVTNQKWAPAPAYRDSPTTTSNPAGPGCKDSRSRGRSQILNSRIWEDLALDDDMSTCSNDSEPHDEVRLRVIRFRNRADVVAKLQALATSLDADEADLETEKPQTLPSGPRPQEVPTDDKAPQNAPVLNRRKRSMSESDLSILRVVAEQAERSANNEASIEQPGSQRPALVRSQSLAEPRQKPSPKSRSKSWTSSLLGFSLGSVLGRKSGRPV